MYWSKFIRRSSLLTLLTVAAALWAVVPAVEGQSLALEQLVVSESQPTGIHDAGDGSGRLFFLSKSGRILVYDGVSILPQDFLDLTGFVNSNGSERGLHGLAFHPDYTENGYFYVMFTDLGSDSNLVRFQVSEDPNVADPTSGQVILFEEQPQEWHNISQLQFGPDGYLYIGAGDGGSIGDPGNRAQNLSELLGKILRIDVDGAFPYAIPADNPFVDTPGARPEIWALGVRNPWRFSFDSLTGDLYMGDVGQSAWEEVNYQPAGSPGGENYGWRLMEGNHCYDPPSGCFDPSFTLPILEYEHGFFGGECAVTGGYVYRGSRFPRFEGLYFYGDWCTGRIWAAQQVDGAWVTSEVLDSSITPNTFGQDAAGEIYVGDDGSGTIYQLIDPIPFCDMAMSEAVYTVGDTVSLSAARLVNLGTGNPPLRVQLTVSRPNGPPFVLADVGGDGSFVLAAGTDLDRGPLDLFTVSAGTPLGGYSVNCRLSDPGSGTTLSTDRAAFEIQ